MIDSSTLSMIRPKQPRLRLSQKKWRELKEYVYWRDGFCLNCGRYDDATAAHVVRRSQGGHDSPDNVIRLCSQCHADFDQYRIALPDRVKQMLAREPAQL